MIWTWSLKAALWLQEVDLEAFEQAEQHPKPELYFGHGSVSFSSKSGRWAGLQPEDAMMLTARMQLLSCSYIPPHYIYLEVGHRAGKVSSDLIWLFSCSPPWAEYVRSLTTEWSQELHVLKCFCFFFFFFFRNIQPGIPSRSVKSEHLACLWIGATELLSQRTCCPLHGLQISFVEEILTRMCWKGLSKACVFPAGMLEEEVLWLVFYVVGWCVEQCPCQNLRNSF